MVSHMDMELRLNMNQISDVSGLAQVLPQTKITNLGLGDNLISDVSGLAQVLPQTQVTRLWLNDNQISDADKDFLQTIKKNKDAEDIVIRGLNFTGKKLWYGRHINRGVS